jgi:hypothetical protein
VNSRVKRLLAGWAFGATLATLALLFARFAEPGRFSLELDIYVLVLGAMALLAVVLAIRGAFTREVGSAVGKALERGPGRAVRPVELERLEREVYLGASTAFDLHYRLRPRLREVALQRLADRRGVDLDRGGRAVKEALGEELWELLRPDREPPLHRHAPGLGVEGVRKAVERLETIQ